ncbi:MAG: hypothetical protein V2J24_03170 [Pseudomonadales bacterium]|jgi:hypothetical protein|nr:hypothetical protein [Pseudomonadales bacterium]
MKAAGSALALALLFVAGFGSADAAADPAASASGHAGVFLSIPPRVEVRQQSGHACAQPMNSAAGTLTVLTESGQSLPVCGGPTTASFEGVETARETRMVLVTPV